MGAGGHFADRADAGRRLAELLLRHEIAEPVVIALPRGGVPVGREVADALGAPLDFLAVRKLGAPHNPEYGFGAVAEDGTRVLDIEALQVLGINGGTVEEIVDRETRELRRRVALYRDERPPLQIEGRTAIVVDDGIATGVTDSAALRALRLRRPGRLLLAVPVCSAEAAPRMRREADEMVCLLEPELLYGVGEWYEDFSQVGDDEVLAALQAGSGAA